MAGRPPPPHTRLRRTRLMGIPFVKEASLSVAALRKLSGYCSYLALQEGDFVFRQGEPAFCFYIILTVRRRCRQLPTAADAADAADSCRQLPTRTRVPHSATAFFPTWTLIALLCCTHSPLPYLCRSPGLLLRCPLPLSYAALSFAALLGCPLLCRSTWLFAALSFAALLGCPLLCRARARSSLT